MFRLYRILVKDFIFVRRLNSLDHTLPRSQHARNIRNRVFRFRATVKRKPPVKILRNQERENRSEPPRTHECHITQNELALNEVLLLSYFSLSVQRGRLIKPSIVLCVQHKRIYTNNFQKDPTFFRDSYSRSVEPNEMRYTFITLFPEPLPSTVLV